VVLVPDCEPLPEAVGGHGKLAFAANVTGDGRSVGPRRSAIEGTCRTQLADDKSGGVVDAAGVVPARHVLLDDLAPCREPEAAFRRRKSEVGDPDVAAERRFEPAETGVERCIGAPGLTAVRRLS